MKTIQASRKAPLSLTNGGALEIIPIGVGSMTSPTHFNTNYLIVKGKTHFLFDCGRTAPEALREVGVSLEDITAMKISHSHEDHIGGVGTLATINRYLGRPAGKPKMKLIAPILSAYKFWGESLRGTLAHNERLNFGGDGELKLHDWFDVVSPELVSLEYRETSILNFSGIDIQSFCTMHVPSQATSWLDSAWSVGILVDGKVFISGDTRFDPELIETYAYQSECMFHDVAFFDDPVHASLKQLRTLPEDIKKKMHLIHYSPKFVDNDVSDFAGYAKQGMRYIFD